MPTRCNRWFLLQILLLAQHVSGTIMPIIRSSRVLYRRLLPVVFGAWFSSCRYGVELRVMCPVCRLLLWASNNNHLLHLVGILFPRILKCLSLLGAFEKLRKATTSFVMSVRVQQVGSHCTDFMKFEISRKTVEKTQIPLKSDKNGRFCTWRPTHI